VLCFSSLCKCVYVFSVKYKVEPSEIHLTIGAQLSSTPRPTTTLDRTNQLDT
jgi:hypothetical protein